MLGFNIPLNSKKVQIALLSFLVAFIFLLSFLMGMKKENINKVLISNNNSIVDYIESFGWKVEKEPLEKEIIYIPSEFSVVYENYNKLQQEQGFDLYKHRSEKVYRYTYKVLNYMDEENVRINLLIGMNGKVLGGDICSTELNGFMEKFK